MPRKKGSGKALAFLLSLLGTAEQKCIDWPCDGEEVRRISQHSVSRSEGDDVVRLDSIGRLSDTGHCQSTGELECRYPRT
jgi:hypothetical protein